MTFQLIDQERPHHAVSLLCSVLDVSRQGYWAWTKRAASRRRQEDERLKPRILAAWNESDQTYGAPRLHAELRLGAGLRVGKKRVARLMRELEIQGVSRRRIKNELVKQRSFVTRDQARLALFRYIESFSNPLRRHSSLAMLSPNDYVARYWEDNAAAAAA